MLSLCRRCLSDPCRSRPPNAVCSGNLRGCPGSVHIPLAAHSPCGRHRLTNLGPDAANSRYRRWLYLNSRIVAVFCRPRTPRSVSLFAVDLRTFGLGGVVVYKR